MVFRLVFQVQVILTQLAGELAPCVWALDFRGVIFRLDPRQYEIECIIGIALTPTKAMEKIHGVHFMVPFSVDVSTLSPLDTQLELYSKGDEQEMCFDKAKQAVIGAQSKQYHWETPRID